MDKKIYCLCGPAANGKSTLSDSLSGAGNCPVVLNADSIREELYGNASIQGDGKEVFGNLFKQLVLCLMDDVTDIIVIDNTSLIYGIRNRYWELVKLICPMFYHKYTYTLVFFNTPLEVALKRNANRDRVVPEDVVRRQYKQYQLATDAELTYEKLHSQFNITKV